MKKFLCVLLAVVMLFGMAACTQTDDVRGNINGGQNDEEKQFALGQTENNHYTNEFLGLSCTLPSEWLFYTDEEILELNNIVAGMVDEDVAEALAEANIIYDMYATDTTDYSSINVNLEKFSALQIVTLDLKANLEAQFDTIKDSFSKMGYSNIQVNYAKVTVDGKEFDGAEISAEIAGIHYYSTLFCFKCERYVANVTVGTMEKAKVNQILGYFSVS